MSQDEHLSEELSEALNATERMLVTLAPRASRIDRDRLMLRLGQQNAARSATPWKWTTAASLLLALGLGVRPAFVSTAGAPAEIAIQSVPADQPPADAEIVARAEPEQVTPPPAERSVRRESDWLAALSSGRFDFARPLTARPELASGELTSRTEVAVRDEDQQSPPPARQPMLRWGDERLKRNVDAIMPRT